MKKTLFLFFCLIFSIAISAQNKFVVVIDAGHGGKDGGTARGKYKEKDINLAVALALGNLLEKNNKDVKVVYTRKTDVFVGLNKRAEIANKAKANLFISIHTNATASKTTTASGACTYILGLAKGEDNLAVAKRENSVILLEDNYSSKYEGFNPNSPESYIIFEFMANKYMEQSLQFATFTQKNIASTAKRKNRGVQQAGFLVLKNTSMPSVLIELGFINNPTEVKFLTSQAGQKSLAEAIYKGFKAYKEDFDKKQGSKRVGASKTKTSTKKRKTVKSNSNKKGEIKYAIQIFTSGKKLATNSSHFKGLSPIEYYKDGNSYKYIYGLTSNSKEIASMKKKVTPKFKDAFVVKFKDGERIN